MRNSYRICLIESFQKIVLICIIFLFFYSNAIQKGYGLISTELIYFEQYPAGNNISPRTKLNVTVGFSNKTEISVVSLLYCSIKPTYHCHYPQLELNEIKENYYFIDFIPEYDVNTLMGYRLIVTYINQSASLIPDSLSFQRFDNIYQTNDSHYYFSVTISDDGNNDINTTPYDSTMFPILTIIVLICYIKIYKGKNPNT